MSNAYAIAGVTSVLQGVISQGFSEHDVTTAIGESPAVRAAPPDTLSSETGVNIFFYQATPNLGWRNKCLPSRNVRAERISNQPLALDLHYLISAHGDNDLFAEILLGSAMQTLHENSVFARQEVQSLLAASSSDSIRDALSNSGLANQLELVKVTPEYLSIEDMSKLWSAVQSSYRPSSAYLVTVVLIEAEEPASSPLPVLTRNVDAHPHLVPLTLTILTVEYEAEQTVGRLGETIAIEGNNLDGTNARAQLSMPSEELFAEFPPITAPSSERLQFDLPTDATIWRSGIYQLSIVIDGPSGSTIESNRVPLIIAPQFSNFIAVRNGDNSVSVDIDVEPEIHDNQSVSLILGQNQQLVESFTGQTNAGRFEFPELAAGDYWARVRVDGIDSILINRTLNPPQFDPTQEVTAP